LTAAASIRGMMNYTYKGGSTSDVRKFPTAPFIWLACHCVEILKLCLFPQSAFAAASSCGRHINITTPHRKGRVVAALSMIPGPAFDVFTNTLEISQIAFALKLEPVPPCGDQSRRRRL